MSKIAARKEAHWRRVIRDQARSGQSIRAWCHSHGHKESAFYWWRTELARRDAARPKSKRTHRIVARRREAPASAAPCESQTLVPVRVVEDKARSVDGHIEIILPGGARVRVAGRVNRQMLADVLAALSRCVNPSDDRSGSIAGTRPC